MKLPLPAYEQWLRISVKIRIFLSINLHINIPHCPSIPHNITTTWIFIFFPFMLLSQLPESEPFLLSMSGIDTKIFSFRVLIFVASFSINVNYINKLLPLSKWCFYWYITIRSFSLNTYIFTMFIQPSLTHSLNSKTIHHILINIQSRYSGQFKSFISFINYPLRFF
jgi:hypothetical protein